MYSKMSEGNIVLPGEQEDHYLLYRLPEFLNAYLFQNNDIQNPKHLLPFEQSNFTKYFPQAKMYIKKNDSMFLICNCHRGGAVKAYNLNTNELILENSGWVISDVKDRTITSLWNDDNYEIEIKDNQLSISGQGHFVFSKVFNPVKNIFFRLFLITFCWHKNIAFLFKILIRKFLMIKSKKSNIFFKRNILINESSCNICDEISKDKQIKIKNFFWGGYISVRYVPQSRYFRLNELKTSTRKISELTLNRFNENNSVSLTDHF